MTNLNDLKSTHMSVAHDAAILGVDAAKAADGFNDLQDSQKEVSYAWWTCKVLLEIIERANIATPESIDNADLRSITFELRTELLGETNG